MKDKSIWENPKLVLALGGWYLLTGGLRAFGFISSLLIYFVMPSVRQLVPFYLYILTGLFLILKLWGAWRYLHLDSKGWAILIVLESWGLLQQAIYFLQYGFGVPAGDPSAAPIANFIIFLATLFLLGKIALLLHTRKYFEKGFKESVLDIKKDWLPWG